MTCYCSEHSEEANESFCRKYSMDNVRTTLGAFATIIAAVLNILVKTSPSSSRRRAPPRLHRF